MKQFKLSKTAHAVSALLLTLASSHTALAAPTGGNVVQGSATISQTSPSRTDINQNTDKAIINWQQFNINSGEQVNFNQPSQSSVTLNRVTGGSASDIQGALTANGNVFLINPNGIVFGKGAIIDVAGLVASTADIDDDNFMAGKFEFTGSGTGSIINEGNISVQQGGLVALVAPTVRNSGVIQAQLGRVALVSGNTFTVDLYGDGLINLAVDGKVAKGLVENSGTVNADGGKVLISAQAAKNIVDNVINMNGVVQARSIAGNNGNIVLSGGVVNVAGTLDASGGASHSGGDIDVLGQSINVAGTVNASGDTGGGEIHIGGDFQGKGDRQRASDTVIAQGAVIQADANTVGDGGRVIVWSDNKTLINGQISATGGSESGDGGFVETSSAGELDFTTSVDVKANNGKAGTWLIDPENITIDRDYADLIEESLNDGSSVIVQTSDVGNEEGNLNVNASITKDEGGDASLSLLAHNDLSVNAPITSTSGELDVNLKAGNSVTVNTSITTNGGGVFISKWDVPDSKPTSAPTNRTPADRTPTTNTESTTTPASESVSIEPTMVVTTATVNPIQAPAPNHTVSVAATDTAAVQAVTVPQTTSVAAVEQSLATDSVMESAPTVANATTDSMGITINQTATLETDGGNIILNSGDQGNTVVSGTVNSRSSLDQGGDVVLAGNTVTLSSTARVDASGDTGGGNIVIGRDASTQNSAISDTVNIAQGAQITSNAGSSGDGGNVFIQAQTSAETHANISAQGSASGTGGTVSISSQQDLNLGGNINVRASNTSNHNGGSLYIAADSLNIRQQRALNAMNQLGMDQLEQFGDIDLNIRTQNDLTFENINNTNSLGQSGDSNGQRTAAFTSTDGNITFVNTSDTLATTGGRLVLDAENGSLDLGNIENSSSQPSSVELYANNSLSANNVSIASGNFVADSLTAGITLGNVSIDDGDISLISESSINTQDLSTQSGDLNIDSIAGSLNLGNVTLAQGNADLIANNAVTTRDISLDNGELNVTAFSGDIQHENVSTSGLTNLQANNNITANGDITVTDGDITLSTTNGQITTNSVTADLGSIDLLARQNIQSNGDISAGNGVLVSSTSGSINTQTVQTDSGDINLTAENGIVVNGGISATTGAVVVDSRAGGISASTVSAREDILFQADQQITVQGTTSSQQGDITVTSKTNDLELGNVTADSGDVLIQARGDIKAGDLTTTAGELDVKTTGGSLALGEIQANQLTALSAIGDIQANSITVESGDTTITSQNGGITIGSVDQDGNIITAGNIITRNGNTLLQADQDIVANDVTSSSELEVRSNSGSMTLGDMNTGGATLLVADNDIETNGISVQSGNLDVLSDNGSIKITNVETLNGNVKLNANESINANDINAEGEVNIATVKDSGGSITVNTVNAKGLTEILADQDVTVNGNVSVDGGDLAISAFRGTTLLMQDVTATDEVRLFAGRDLTTQGISGASVNAGSKFGAVKLGSINTDGNVEIKASQSITIGETQANILLAQTLGSTFTSNGIIRANEVSIDADSIFFQGASSTNAADVIATHLTLDIDEDGKVEGNIAGNPGGGVVLQTRNRDSQLADNPVLTRFRAQFNDSANSGQSFSELDTFVSGQDLANLSGADFDVAFRNSSLAAYDTYIYQPSPDPDVPFLTAQRGNGPTVAVSLDESLSDVETPGPSNNSQNQRNGITTRNVASQGPDSISTERHNRANRQSGPEPELPTISSAPGIDGTILDAPVAPVIEEPTEQEPVIQVNTMPTANNTIETAPAVLDPNMDSLDQANQQASDIVVPITVENDESGCGNNNHLAWLQSGIRSAAETADMGRGDGTSGEDVFKNCY